MCTIAETPRKPEHCVAYAFMKLWPDAFPDRTLDTDSPDDMRWIHERAAERAARFGIEGVSYTLTLGVVKNIIPAIASTNAAVSAACALEALKLATFAGQTLNNYLMYMGSTGMYSSSVIYERKDVCPACRSSSLPLPVRRSETLGELLTRLRTAPAFQLSNPSVRCVGRSLFMANPPALRDATAPNLARAMGVLVEDGDQLVITDPAFTSSSVLLLDVQFLPDGS